MKKRRYAAVRSAVFLLLVLLYTTAVPAAFSFVAYAEDVNRQERKIKVGLPAIEGFSGVYSDGSYTGYTYDYLMQLSQYTGWEYDFVTMDGDLNTVLTKMYKMLEDGELDLMGGTVYSRELAEKYSYPGDSYGTSHLVLYAWSNIANPDFSIYENRTAVKIAVIEGAEQTNKKLIEFCKMTGISPELVNCKSVEEEIEKVKTGAADVLLSKDISPLEGFHVIAEFSPESFFLVTGKGNQELLGELNSGIMMLNEADPYFVQTLHQKYFNSPADTSDFTAGEKEYIEEAPAIRVGVDTGRAPIQYLDKSTGEIRGITKDVFSYLSEITGLVFELIPLASQEEAYEKVKSGEVELVAGMGYDYQLAENSGVYLTQPYLRSQATMAINNRLDYNRLAGKRLALARGLEYAGPFIGTVTLYNSTEECMKAVLSGKEDYCYGSSYSLQYYKSDPAYRNITLVPQSARMLSFCIGVSKASDLHLSAVINRAIRNMSEEKLQYIIYSNTIAAGRSITLIGWFYENPEKAVLIIAAVALTVFGILFWILYTKTKAGRQLTLSNERYQQLCELSNEYLFEYDYKNDRLMMSEQYAKQFHINRVEEACIERLKGRSTGEAEKAVEFFRSVRQKHSITADLSMRYPDGRNRWTRITAKAICDARGEAVYCIGKMTDIQKEKEEKERLVEKARMDSLTEVYNSAAIRRLISEQLKRQGEEGRCGALAILDLDYFKRVNDLYGHYIGDQALILVASILRRIFCEDAVVGRLGGDEFVVYISEFGSAQKLGQKFDELRLKAKEAVLDGQPVKLSISVGIIKTKGYEEFDLAYKKADEVLYRVKKEGRDHYKILEETEE